MPVVGGSGGSSSSPASRAGCAPLPSSPSPRREGVGPDGPVQPPPPLLLASLSLGFLRLAVCAWLAPSGLPSTERAPRARLRASAMARPSEAPAALLTHVPASARRSSQR